MARGTRDYAGGTVPQRDMRAIIYSPIAARQAWMETELARGGTLLQIGRSIEHLVAALVEDPAPRPQLLVIDVDALSGLDLLRLHAIRERGWFGTIIAVGDVPPDLRKSLGIDGVVATPFAQDVLGDALDRQRIEVAAKTTRMPLFPDDDLPEIEIVA